MINAGDLESQIYNVEGFNIRITQNGKDVRSDKVDFADWPYQKQSKGVMTVSDWIIKKFQTQYPGYSVDVLKGDGSVAYGNILLKNIR